MCTICGCGGDARGEAFMCGGHAPSCGGHVDSYAHDHDHHHHHGDHGDITQARMIEIEANILAKNDRYAAENRRRLAAGANFALNLVSSPGSGKTTLLVETIRRATGRFAVAVIEGDQQTTNDADRIRAAGAPAIQINTGKGCHLDAHMVGHALDHLAPPEQAVLFIENVGNLVCPAAFDLGEDAKVAILSVTEGEDKPLKYPDMFAAASLMLINKTDLAPYVDFDIAACEANARRINPAIEILRVSARTDEGLDGWLAWIEARRRAVLRRSVQAAEERLAQLRAAAG